jgi:hypothetical protein
VRRRSKAVGLLATVVMLGALMAAPATAGAAGIASPGFAVSDFATGFPTENRFGPMGLAFDSHGTLFAVDNTDGNLYKFSPAGGLAGGPNLVSTSPITGYLIGLAFDKAGDLFVARQEVEGGGDVAQLNPATGAVIRIVVSGLEPLGLATDPVSGDLFVAADGSPIKRIVNPASENPTITDYGEPLSGPDGITFGPEGTLYTEDEGNIISITGTASPTPGVNTTVGFVSEADGIAVAETTNPNEQPFLAVNSNDGSITKVDLATTPVTYTPMVTDGTRGDLVAVGPDSCLYATQLESIEKVTAANGTCPFYPSSPFHCSNKIGGVSPATGHVAIGGSGASIVTITGKSFCAGSQVQFGNTSAVANATMVSPSELTVTVPANATSGNLSVIDPYGNTGPGVPYTINTYRNTNGFSFVNDAGAPKGDVDFSDVAAAFGSAAYVPWSLCSHCKGSQTPTTEALQILAEAQKTLEGGLCFGLAMGSLRVSQGLDPLNSTSDPRRTAATWAAADTWALPEWQNALDPYKSQMRHYLYAQAIRQFSVQYNDQLSGYLAGLKRSANRPNYLYTQVRAALSHGLALISLQVHYHDPKTSSLNPFEHIPGVKNAWDGHELVAYEVEPPQPDGSFNIDVYDPNHPYLAAEDSNATLHQQELYTSQIHLDGSGNWTFNGDFAGAAGTMWNGPVDQIVPVAFDTVHGNLTPLSQGGAQAVATGAAVGQVTDAQGHTLYDAQGEPVPLQARADVQVMALAEPSATTSGPAQAPALLLDSSGTYKETVAPGTQNLFDDNLDGTLSTRAGGQGQLALGKGEIGVTPAKPSAVSLQLTRHDGGGRTTIGVAGTVTGTATLRAASTVTITASGTISLTVSRVGPGPPQTFRSVSLHLSRGERLELGALQRLDPGASTIHATVSDGGHKRTVTLINRAPRPSVRITRVSAKRGHDKTRVTVRLATAGARGGQVLVTVRGASHTATTTEIAARSRATIPLLLSAQRRGQRLRVWAVALTDGGQAGRIATATVRAR